MKEKTLVSSSLKLALTGLIIAVVIALAACAPTGSAGEKEVDAKEYPPGSLMAQHTQGELDGQTDFSKKRCLSCHDRKTITAANENYGGVEGVNPHAAHTEAYECITCHSVEGVSVLVCNDACHHHEWQLPDGWQNPTSELPSADGEGV